MLKKSFRLRKNEDFKKVFRFGKPLFFKPFGCRILPNNLESDRLGFSFSKKHCKKAVLRNRLRRRISALYLKEGYNFKGRDIIFFTTDTIVKVEKEVILDFLKKIEQTI